MNNLLPFDITNKECDKSFAENRPCMACSFFSGQVHKHTLEEINRVELHREKLLEECRRHEQQKVKSVE